MVVDRRNRKHLIIIAHLGISATLLALGIALAFDSSVITRQNQAGMAGFLADFSDGLALFRANSELRVLTLLAGVSLPIGQLSNAILSSFIHDDLGCGSDAFGFVDAA